VNHTPQSRLAPRLVHPADIERNWWPTCSGISDGHGL